MKVNFVQELPARTDLQLFILTLFEGERPPRGICGLLDWHFNGRLSKLILEDRLNGEFASKLFINGAPRLPWERYIIVGIGRPENLTRERYKAISSEIVDTLLSMNLGSVCCELPGFHRLNFEFSRALEIFLGEIERRRITFHDFNIIWLEELIEP